MLKAKIQVTVWIPEEEKIFQKVELTLDDAFRFDQLGQAGSALQRGMYDALEKAALECLRKQAREKSK